MPSTSVAIVYRHVFRRGCRHVRHKCRHVLISVGLISVELIRVGLSSVGMRSIGRSGGGVKTPPRRHVFRHAVADMRPR